MNNLFLSSPKISCIVPVYNVEKYLRRCLDSILAQTFTDFECICVDDGSSDGSGKILDEYAARDGRSATTLSQESILHMMPTEKRLAEYREESMCFLKRILGKNAS